MSSTAAIEKTPFHLRGNYAPVPSEETFTDLEVDGAIPPGLCGRYLRNGANPKDVKTRHWFFGDGMIHGVALEHGKASWYRNRWVRTRHLATRRPPTGPDGSRDLGAGQANTNIVSHAGRILALTETTAPWELTRDLDTVGVHDFDGRLITGMTAHPKICPTTGEMHFFDYGWMHPFLTYHCADAQGRLLRSLPIEVAGPTMIHDFAITARHVIFMDLPVVFDLERAMRGSMPYRWDDDYGARVGVMERGGSAVRWFDVAPCYVFHPMNAFERDGRIVVDVARYPEMWRGDAARFDLASLHRWELDLSSGKVAETALDDRPIEFPRIDDRLCGLPNRYGYAIRNVSSTESPANSLLKYDLASGTSVEHDFGPGRFPGEGAFAADPSSREEDAGWVMTYVYDAARDASDFVILDAQRFAAPPTAVVHLPVRVPFGFHGNWIAD